MSFADINWRFWQKPSKPEVDPEYEARALASWLVRDGGSAAYVGPAFCEVVRRLEALEAAEADRNAVMDDFWATYSRVSGGWASTPNWRDAAKIIRGR